MQINQKIPPIIHYCWFGGGKMNFILSKCVSTFHKLIRGGEIICWNESQLPIIANEYVNKQIENKEWAFASDYVRLWALYEYGGIYLDTDIEVKKKLPDSFFEAEMIIGYSYDNIVCTAFIMVKPRHPFIKYLLEKYDNLTPDKKIVNNGLFTQALLDYYPNFILDGKYHEFASNTFIYPRDYFDSSTYHAMAGYTVHHGMGSWKKYECPILRLLRPMVKFAKFYIKPFAVWYMNRVNKKMVMNSGHFLEIYKKNISNK